MRHERIVAYAHQEGKQKYNHTPPLAVEGSGTGASGMTLTRHFTSRVSYIGGNKDVIDQKVPRNIGRLTSDATWDLKTLAGGSAAGFCCDPDKVDPTD